MLIMHGRLGAAIAADRVGYESASQFSGERAGERESTHMNKRAPHTHLKAPPLRCMKRARKGQTLALSSIARHTPSLKQCGRCVRQSYQIGSRSDRLVFTKGDRSGTTGPGHGQNRPRLRQCLAVANSLQDQKFICCSTREMTRRFCSTRVRATAEVFRGR
jgi:hypothetical protein